MSSFLWCSGFGAHAYRLSFPTIADVMDITDASFAAVAQMKKPTNSEISEDNTAITLPDVTVESLQDTEVFRPTADNYAGIDTKSTRDVDNTLSVNTLDNASDVIDTSETASQSRGTDIESIRNGDNIFRAHDTLDKLRSIDSTEATMQEVRSRRHVLPITSTSGVNEIFDHSDDVGVFASSEHYNEFERFLAQDRMWGMHAPAKRAINRTASNGKTIGQAKKIAVTTSKALIENLKCLVEINTSTDVEATKVVGPSNHAGATETCIPSNADLPAHTRKLSTE